MMKRLLAVLFVAGLAVSSPALAGEADVVAVAVERHAGTEDMFDFRVTVLSNDQDTAYYADAVEVLGPDGRVITRHELAQPQAEQPFTHVLADVRVPVGVQRVTVRVHHKPRGYDGQTVSIQLPR
jgi:hypothetical protein